MAAAFLLSPPFGYDAGMSFTYPKIVTPTSSLLVVDLLRDRMDGQIAACVLQGIVNRQREQKAYVMNTYCFDNKRGGRRQAQVAERFLTQLFNDIPTERLAPADDRNWPGFMAMLDRFADCVKGLVIWDPKLEQATIEAATTIAGQTDALVVSPDLAEALSGRGFPIIADLRANEFPGNLECLQWLKEHWFAGSGKEVAFTWSHMTTDGRSWGAANKDFVVAHRLFTFYLDVTRDAEREHYIYILKEYPPGTPVLGWSDERWFDALLARLGYFMVPYISVENLTVHSSFPSTTGTQPPPQPAPVHDDGVYIAFHIADGDNLEHAVTYMPDTIMTSLSYGQVPVTWIVNPGLIDLAPRLFEWYMARLGTQEMAAMMGDGHPGSDRYAAFRFYCDMAHNYMQRAGIRTMKQMAEAEAVAWNVQPYMINSGYAGTDPPRRRPLRVPHGRPNLPHRQRLPEGRCGIHPQSRPQRPAQPAPVPQRVLGHGVPRLPRCYPADGRSSEGRRDGRRAPLLLSQEHGLGRHLSSVERPAAHWNSRHASRAICTQRLSRHGWRASVCTSFMTNST